VRKHSPGLTRPVLAPVPPTIEDTPDGVRVWCKPAGGRQTWEVIVKRANPLALTDLIVRIAWDLRVPVDTAEDLAAKVMERLGR